MQVSAAFPLRAELRLEGGLPRGSAAARAVGRQDVGAVPAHDLAGPRLEISGAVRAEAAQRGLVVRVVRVAPPVVPRGRGRGEVVVWGAPVGWMKAQVELE